MKKLLLLPLFLVLCGFTYDPPDITELNRGSGVAVATPADTSEDTLVSLIVPGFKPNSSIDLYANFTYTNNANNKTIKFKYGAVGSATNVFFTGTLTTTVGTRLHGNIANRNATNSQVVESDFVHATGAAGVQNIGSTFAIDLSVPWQLVITCQKAVSGDSCQLENWNYEISP